MQPTQPLLASEGLVASAHPLASLTGVRIMQEGGNAFDAAIAVNAVLNVTQPHMCGVGGDIFYLIYSPSEGKVRFLNGSGRASRGASIDYYLARGLKRIPLYCELSCITVCGCVSGWEALHKRYCTMSLAHLLSPAIKYALEGIPVSIGLAEAIEHASRVKMNPAWAKIYMPNGRAPRQGEMLKQEDLGRTLRVIADGGADAFYGTLAEGVAEHEPEIPLSEEDFRVHTSDWGEPISTLYRGYTVYETPPNTQAISTLIALNILEGFGLEQMPHLSVESIHVMVEAIRLAYEDRARYVADPVFVDIPISSLLSKGHADELRGRMDQKSARNYPSIFSGSSGDTTYFAVVDKERNCVSCVQSLYHPFGSGVVVEGTGVVLHNRGSYFTLDRSHHNRLEPRKRPFHTLCASLVFRETEPYMVLGCMGGDAQPQTHTQIITSVVDYHLNIQEAIYAPRWVLPGTIYEGQGMLLLEGRLPDKTVEGLRSLGHRVRLEEPFSSLMGHAQAVVVEDGGRTLCGAADPRGDGLPIGY